ncbi:N-acetylneuraminate synthase [Brevundimonas basaltis]|uniref:N-acetylneuraminate synthase n=1 Tax=Brevundimonas basaltis TaxID=472166 RepID=A0A7W8I0V0_9CAUL|nr:N-acetylneuraminate synthase [Brevundimonas basaltis]MBB5292658.1 N-acetylneuraminate synthase [Brevundimonas basaltis]
MTEPVLIIAEAGVNHDGSLEDAGRMIDVAAEAGADVVKFQTFEPEAVLTVRAMKAAYQATNTGEGGTQLDMVRRLALSRDDHRALADRCEKRGVRFMSTAFDMGSLEFLSGLDMPAVKIPSGDLTWGAMLLAAARVGPPLIVSTGMATLAEVRAALAVIAFGLTRDGDPGGADDLDQAFADGQAALRERVTLLHCTTEYPAPLEAINLRAMTTMAETFGLRVGYSDHSLGQTVAIAAVARGACVIEKHFTLSRGRPGPDHPASLEPDELAAMVRSIRDVETALGRAEKQPAPAELGNLAIARRALVAARSIRKGEVLTPDAVTAKRPADGLSPMDQWRLIGTVAQRDYAPNNALEEPGEGQGRP